MSMPPTHTIGPRVCAGHDDAAQCLRKPTAGVQTRRDVISAPNLTSPAGEGVFSTCGSAGRSSVVRITLPLGGREPPHRLGPCWALLRAPAAVGRGAARRWRLVEVLACCRQTKRRRRSWSGGFRSLRWKAGRASRTTAARTRRTWAAGLFRHPGAQPIGLLVDGRVAPAGSEHAPVTMYAVRSLMAKRDGSWRDESCRRNAVCARYAARSSKVELGWIPIENGHWF